MLSRAALCARPLYCVCPALQLWCHWADYTRKASWRTGLLLLFATQPPRRLAPCRHPFPCESCWLCPLSCPSQHTRPSTGSSLHLWSSVLPAALVPFPANGPLSRLCTCARCEPREEVSSCTHGRISSRASALGAPERQTMLNMGPIL